MHAVTPQQSVNVPITKAPALSCELNHSGLQLFILRLHLGHVVQPLLSWYGLFLLQRANNCGLSASNIESPNMLSASPPNSIPTLLSVG